MITPILGSGKLRSNAVFFEYCVQGELLTIPILGKVNSESRVDIDFKGLL